MYACTSLYICSCGQQVRQCTAAKLKKLMNFDLTQKYPRDGKKTARFWVLTIVSVIWDIIGALLIVLGA